MGQQYISAPSAFILCDLRGKPVFVEVWVISKNSSHLPMVTFLWWVTARLLKNVTLQLISFGRYLVH